MSYDNEVESEGSMEYDTEDNLQMGESEEVLKEMELEYRFQNVSQIMQHFGLPAVAINTPHNLQAFAASLIFNHADYNFLHPDNNVSPMNAQMILKTMCYLDKNNPFMKVDRDTLLNQSCADPNLNANLILNMFADGLAPHLYEQEHSKLLVGGSPIHVIPSIIEEVIELRKHRPFNCPIKGEDLDALLELILIMEVPSAKVNFNHEENYLFHKAIIEGMAEGTKVMLPGRSANHAFLVEVGRKSESQYAVTIINSGTGIAEFHRRLNDKWEYFVHYNLSLKQIKDLRYFVNENAPIEWFYSSEGKVNSQLPVNPADTIKGQKSGTCHIKSIHLLVKWFLRHVDPTNELYVWWKVWHLRYRALDIHKFWGKVAAKPIPFSDLPFAAPTEHSVASTILFLQATRLLRIVKHMKNRSLQQSCLQMLTEIPMLPEWGRLFQAYGSL